MSNPNVTVDRHKYVGGSDLPSILGLNSKYGTKIFEFAKEKVGIIPKTFKGNQFTKYGQLMEPTIRDYINSTYGAKYVEDTIIDTDRKYRGNTDGIDPLTEIPILEVKTFGKELDVVYYEAQCQFYMETFNQPACRLVGYKRPDDFYTGVDYELEFGDEYFNLEFNENRIEEHIIYRNKDKWFKIENRIEAFKNACEKLKENPNMTEEEFNSIFYGTEVITLSNKITTLEKQLTQLSEINEEYTKAKDELYKLFEAKNIISFETDNIKITKVSPSSYEKTTVDTKKLEEDYSEIYNKYKVTKTVNKKGYILITNKDKEGK